MGQNKQAMIRYRAIDKCLSNRKVKYTGVQIKEKVDEALATYDPQTKGISRAQFYADLEFMKSSDGWNVEIKQSRYGRNVYLRYEEDGFSIQNMPLTELELTQLNEALNVLKQFRGMPQFEWMEEVSAKLQQEIKQEQAQPVIAFDANQYLKGIEWLGDLYNAIQYRKVLAVSYQDFKSPEPYEIIFHPYYLKQYNNRWFCFGHNPSGTAQTWTIALDRIHELKELNQTYVPNASINFEEYFEDIIGVTKPADEQVQLIELRVAPERAGYVLTKPLHGSQTKLKQDESGLYLTLELIPNQELLQMILSFGSQIEVLSPESLKRRVREILSQAISNYSS